MTLGTFALLAFLAVLLFGGIVVMLMLRRFNRWMDDMCQQGLGGMIVAFLTLLFVAMAIAGLVVAVITFLAYLVGGAALGALFALPVLFGAPWWVLIIMGTALGAIVYFWQGRKQANALE